MIPALDIPCTPRRLEFWKGITLALMFAGYAGYYLCRSDLSVSLPLIVADLAAHGMDPNVARVRLGSIISIGVLAYAAGKLFLSGFADFFGGKTNFLGCMAGAIMFTLLFGLGGGLPIFTLAWIGNRFLQAGGWAGMVKISSKWFNYSSYGSVMGTLSLSFLFGDAAARQFMGMLIRSGVGWRGVFLTAGGTLFAIFVINLIFLKESCQQIGAAQPTTSPMNLFAGEESHKPKGILDLYGPFLRSPLFLLVCTLSLGVTIVRETFNTWTPTYLNQAIGFSQADAASLSALFPFFGGVSVLLAGFLSDRLGHTGRARVMMFALTITTAALVGLSRLHPGVSSYLPVALVSLVALGLLGPYSYLGGAMAMDFGGHKGGAAASGIIDSVGYLGGAVSGDTVARVSVAFGWKMVFLLLGGVALLSAAAALVLYRMERRTVR